ncbi:hypothetical protein SSPO_021190 [Streptomyces antimycoticus]|uniref:Uncharacterized protein n=1 Tax=Streptomyces antimycoticus TaxID=68175 RepID=A0A499UQB7_9ACTN|nr:hypothetical protein SSPO_021190 [Streptomyces antimycoticus]
MALGGLDDGAGAADGDGPALDHPLTEVDQDLRDVDGDRAHLVTRPAQGGGVREGSVQFALDTAQLGVRIAPIGPGYADP